MKEDLRIYEQSIKSKSCFGWTPKYEETFRTQLSEIVFIPIAQEAIKNLGWDLLLVEGNAVIARKNASGFHWGQKITVSFQGGNVNVQSESLQTFLLDYGRNFKRVKLFIYAFRQVEKMNDKASLKELEEITVKSNNWDDYEIPAILPVPPLEQRPRPWIAFGLAVLLASSLGFLLALLSVKFVYIRGVYEVGIGFLIGIGFKYLMRWSNYQDIDKLFYLLIGIVGLVFLSHQYFTYLLSVPKDLVGALSFFDFMVLRIQSGLVIKSINTSSIGLVISWVFQIWIIYLVGYLQLVSRWSEDLMDKVPKEVVDFAVYHIVKGKEESEIRKELSKLGWSEKKDQDNVFNLLGYIQEVQDIEDYY